MRLTPLLHKYCSNFDIASQIIEQFSASHYFNSLKMIRIHRRTSAAQKRTILNTVRHAASEIFAAGGAGIIVGAAITFTYNNNLIALFSISVKEREAHNLASKNEIERRNSIELALNNEMERRASIEARSLIIENDKNELNIKNAILTTEKASIEARCVTFEGEKNQLNILNAALAQEKIGQHSILSQEIEKRSSIEAKRASIEAKYKILETERNKLENREKGNQEERLEFFKSMGNTNKIGQWGELTLRRTVERAGLIQGNY